MNILKQLNDAAAYIEANLCAEFDPDEAAKIACVTTDSFQRFFSYMTGMTLNEYIRRRRLTLAAEELLNSRAPVVDIAVKYGYDSAAAFSRAFARQHGITPSLCRKNGGPLKLCPPVSFHITIKGAEDMDFRLIELEETKLYGISKPYDGQGYRNREELRHSMWSDNYDDVPGQLCGGRWNEPGSTAFDGVWYGIWQGGRYMIARDTIREGASAETFTLPAGTYAAFRTEPGGVAWEEFPKLFGLIFDSWLPSSGYRQKSDLAVEILHLWTDHDIRQKQRYYEVWIPVERK
ncbi:MAG: AraC family transcriptional regulator [Clostridia bacterium]|nr:AraC family transcriptional regulator [Clostridia bacterium]